MRCCGARSYWDGMGRSMRWRERGTDRPPCPLSSSMPQRGPLAAKSVPAATVKIRHNHACARVCHCNNLLLNNVYTSISRPSKVRCVQFWPSANISDGPDLDPKRAGHVPPAIRNFRLVSLRQVFKFLVYLNLKQTTASSQQPAATTHHPPPTPHRRVAA